MARRFWRGRDPIGSKIVMTFSGRRDIREIIGVVGATRHDGLDDDPDPALFIPHAQFPTGSIAFVARTSGDPVSLLPAVRAALREINGGIPVSRAASLEQLLDTTLKPRRFNLLLLLCFSGTALILAASGIYGVMSYVAGSRIREIGVRLALGARPSGVLSLVMRQGLAMTLCGIACGTLGALALTRVLTSMLYGITPFDLFTFLATAGIVLAAAVAACLIPAVRATRVDVLRVLRCD
jgi:putative ABC transport system permease protein